MSGGAGGLAPVRVERALGLLPDLEVLNPLRALLVSISRPDERTMWSSSGPYLTLGKRGVQPEELRRHLPPLLHSIAGHMRGLYDAYAEALECQQRSDGAGAAAALVKAGRSEEKVGRLAQALTWYETALAIAEGLQDRRPELGALRSLGEVCLALGRYTEAARHFQRSLAISEAEFDQASAIIACDRLGDAALAQSEWAGAEAWYGRGLRLAEGARDARGMGRLERSLAMLARKQGDLTTADVHLRRARALVESVGAADAMAQVLNGQGQLDAQLGRHSAAYATYREALAWAQRGPRDAGLEVSIRLNLAELQLETGRFLEAEAELRRAEQVAIAENLTSPLVQIYTLMGKLRGQQLDDTGFVFFEQAIELSRALERSPAISARVYVEYGLFKNQLGQHEEARGYLERAREIFESLGEAPDVERVASELQRMSA